MKQEHINDELEYINLIALKNKFSILKNYSFSREVEVTTSSKYRHVHYGDIHTKYSGIIDNNVFVPFLKEDIKINQDDIVKAGDVVMADASEDYEDLGKSVYISNNLDVPTFSGLHTFHLRPNDTYDGLYFKYFTETKYFKKQMARLGTGLSVFGISKKNLENVLIPDIDINTQKKHAQLLSSIDDLINMQMSIKVSKQLELEYLKKQLVKIDGTQKLKLSNLIKTYNERNSLDDTEPVAVGKYGIRLRSEIYSNELSKDLSKNKVIFKDTITFGMGSTQIDYGILTDEVRYCVSPAYHTYKVQTNVILPEYLKYLFDTNITRLSKLYMITSARQGKSVDFEGLLNHYFTFPDMQIQIKHVELLSNMEELINSTDKLIKQYKEFKKYYLNLIFK